MFDMGLHFRFLQKATEALFEMGQASVAATLAMQSRVHEGLTSEGARPAEFLEWPVFAFPTPEARTQAAAAWPFDSSGSIQWHAWFDSWMQLAPMIAQHSYSAPTAPAAWAFGWSIPAGWPLAPVSPWTFYQAPMVACMLSYGVPYAVAAPTARASTSAMDAADAACTQFRLMFGNDNERDGPTRRRATR